MDQPNQAVSTDHLETPDHPSTMPAHDDGKRRPSLAIPALVLGLLLGIGGTAWISGSAAEPANAPAGEAAASERGGPPPASVRVGVASMRPTTPSIHLIGRLREARRVVLAAEASGRLMTEPVLEVGTQVDANETVMARVEPIWTELELRRAQAALAAAQARTELAAIESDRQIELAGANAARQEEVDRSRAELLNAQANEAQAQAEVDLRETELRRLEITAPFDGIIVRRIAEAGQWLERGDEVMEVISRGSIDAVIDVPEMHVNRCQLGDSLAVYVEPLARFVEGTVVAINPDNRGAARTYPILVRLLDPHDELKPGMSAWLDLPIGPEAPGLIVPTDAVSMTPEGSRVWVAMDTGEGLPIALPVFVEVLALTPDGRVVQPLKLNPDERVPLFPGAQVVVQGQERIFFPGMSLAVVPESAGGPPPSGGVAEVNDVHSAAHSTESAE